ncbi:hypothetical protein BHF71_04725 [Vulcanibacillus modesticaldus]|uniref:Uncharacterized protein n=1 Tax=Vulcanibacillus modesticaldus TaxID=337097 RepID=A0A1D2YRN9_9BACI|nr:hypothetical protein [Vulcanibacillus modesticaldus]OEF95500.1 hypothetical protein BHF71_04725 [Vulcanibacillus modesticaldus]
MKRYNAFTWIIIFLILIGFFTTLINNFFDFIIPILVFGSIYYFLKHPEKLNAIFYRKYRHNNPFNFSRKHYKPRKNNIKFKVIDGKFRDINDD